MSAPATFELDAQYRQAREECGLLDRSGRGKLAIRGPDGAEYLQGQLTNDIEALGEGEGCRAELLDRKGHIQADLRVLCLSAGDIWLDTDTAGAGTALRHLRMYSVGRDVEVCDLSDTHALISLLGPRAEELSGAVRGEEYSVTAVTLAGTPVHAATTRDGFDLIFDAAQRDRVLTHLMDTGAVEVTEDAAEILRIEAGVPRFGAEMTTETMPAEAGIVEETVSFTKGCYIGQETVARLHYRGRPNRHLRGLRLSGSAAPGTELRLGERTVGVLGSACVSPVFGPIGLAIVRREAEPGLTLIGEGDLEAEVVELPFESSAS